MRSRSIAGWRQKVAGGLLTLALALAGSGPAAQDGGARAQTLADIRQELSVLFVEIQRLKRELSTTGGVGVGLAGGSLLERVDLLEAELRRLTARTERLENRINRIVEDGTNRIGDLEFRLVELEGGDVSQLGETTTLGGVDPRDELTAAAPPPDDGAPLLAVGEQRDFDQARAALEAGENFRASQLFAEFLENYPGSPLAAEAQFLRGEALSGLGDTANAARAFLESFSGDPQGVRAPEALLRLGVSLGQLEQISEACITLGEVAQRYPDSAAVADAVAAMQDLGCP